MYYTTLSSTATSLYYKPKARIQTNATYNRRVNYRNASISRANPANPVAHHLIKLLHAAHIHTQARSLRPAVHYPLPLPTTLYSTHRPRSPSTSERRRIPTGSPSMHCLRARTPIGIYTTHTGVGAHTHTHSHVCLRGHTHPFNASEVMA